MSDLILESNRQFQQAWKFFAERIPGGECRELDGVVASFANVPVAFFNVILLTGPAPSLDALSKRLQAGLQYASSSPHPWMFSLCDEWLPADAGTACQDLGLFPVLTLHGMAADSLSEPIRPLPDLEFRRIATESEILAIAEINAQAYGMPAASADSLAAPAIWDESAYGYIGIRNGSAVSASATFVVDKRLYVGWVATLPGHQKMGYAEAVMRRSLQHAEAETGLRRTVLHATPAGASLYRQMGYQPAADFTLYSTQPPPAD